MIISEQIKEELNIGGKKYTFLNDQEIKYIRETIKKIYINESKKGSFMWEKLSEFKIKQDSEAWKYISDFVKEETCIVFFNTEDDKNMIKLYSGNDLKYMLEETYGYEFYVTDEECTYLICFNHHDILYTCGRAIKWLELL